MLFFVSCASGYLNIDYILGSFFYRSILNGNIKGQSQTPYPNLSRLVRYIDMRVSRPYILQQLFCMRSELRFAKMELYIPM